MTLGTPQRQPLPVTGKKGFVSHTQMYGPRNGIPVGLRRLVVENWFDVADVRVARDVLAGAREVFGIGLTNEASLRRWSDLRKVPMIVLLQEFQRRLVLYV